MTTAAKSHSAADRTGSPCSHVEALPHSVPGSGELVFMRPIRLDKDGEKKRPSPSLQAGRRAFQPEPSHTGTLTSDLQP